MEVKPTYLGTMIALATTAFGLLAAGAWNNAIQSIFAIFAPKQGWLGLVIYAILVTILAIIVVQQLGKLAEKLEKK